METQADMADHQSLQEQKEIILRTIRVRRVTLAVFLGIALLLRFGAGFNFPLPLIFSPLMWGLMTVPFEKLMDSRQSKETLNKLHFGFFILEILILTYLIHIIGGVEWIGVAYYLFSVIYANFFLPPKKAWTVTGLAICLFGLMGYAEYLGLVPHWSLFSTESMRYKDSFYVVTTVLAGGLGIYVTVAYTVQIFASLFREQNRSLREREKKLQNLWKKLLAAREEERSRIAKELHDGLGQQLMGIKLKLDILRRELDRREIEESSSLLEEAIQSSRNLSHKLRPSLLDELGLIPAVRRVIEDFGTSTGIQTEMNFDSSIEVRDEDTKTVLFRALQELLSNANKHGKPDQVRVSLTRKDKGLRLEVYDDGQGFDPDSVAKKSGLGLQGIQENVQIIGGQFEIQSQPEEGTRAIIHVPA